MIFKTSKKTFIIRTVALFTLSAVILTGVSPVYAYNDMEYEMMERDFVVDNKHNSPSHVNLFVLSMELVDGFFGYRFYQTDGRNHQVDAEYTTLIYYTRVGNLKKVKEFDDGSYLYLGTFGIENGKYVFSNNYCLDNNTTLTPDYKNPAVLNPVDPSDYTGSYVEHFVDVYDESINVYCLLGSTEWAKEHFDILAAFAKEHDNPAADTFATTAEMDELRDVLSKNGYDSDVLNGFLSALEEAENTDNVLNTNDMADDATGSVSDRETSNVPVPIKDEKPKSTPFAWIIAAIVIILFVAGCIWQKKKKNAGQAPV